MDLIGGGVESRVVCRVETGAYDVFSTHAPVLFNEKQRFSESAQDWQIQVTRKLD